MNLLQYSASVHYLDGRTTVKLNDRRESEIDINSSTRNRNNNQDKPRHLIYTYNSDWEHKFQAVWERLE